MFILTIVATMWTDTAQAQTRYKIYIAGTQVTSDNCNDLSVIPGVTGKVRYNPNKNTLILDNATIKNKVHPGISTYQELDITVIGNCKIETNRTSIGAYESLRIDGDYGDYKDAPRLDVVGGDCAIYVLHTELTINDCIVSAKATDNDGVGIAGDYNENKSALTVKGGFPHVTAEGKGGSICRIVKFTLDDCTITEPAGAYYDSSLKGIALNGKLVTDKVVIAPTAYRLMITDKLVTVDNCNDLSVIDDVSGTVKYDNATKTLTLQDARINARRYAIYSGIEDLTIKVIGSNELNSKEFSIYTDRPLTITGGGILNAESSEGSGICIYDTELIIDNCTVNVKGNYGIVGDRSTIERLTVRNATVTAEGRGKGRGSICDLASLVLKGCYITEPAGAAFDASQNAVALDGHIVNERVVIKKDPTAIDTPTANAATKQGIYTLEGMRLRGSFENLPKGMYIVNGRKVVKK